MVWESSARAGGVTGAGRCEAWWARCDAWGGLERRSESIPAPSVAVVRSASGHRHGPAGALKWCGRGRPIGRHPRRGLLDTVLSWLSVPAATLRILELTRVGRRTAEHVRERAHPARVQQVIGRLYKSGLTRVCRQLLPPLLFTQYRLLICREMTLKQGECLAQPRRRWRDDAVQAKLVCCQPHTVTRRIVADLAHQILDSQPDGDLVLAHSQVEDRRDTHVACQETAWSHQLGPHPFDRLNEMTIGLNDHRSGGPRQIEDGKGSLRPPPAARCTAGESPVSQRGVTLKGPFDRDRVCPSHRYSEGPIHRYIAPDASRSMAASTCSNSPSTSRSIGLRPSSSRLREWIQMSTPSGV